MDYFNFKNIDDYLEEVGTRYNSNSKGTKWYLDTRYKLHQLVTMLDGELKERVIRNYGEKPNKQAGRGKGFVLKDYILVGFLPEKYKTISSWLFIKMKFMTGNEGEKVHFVLEIDINEKQQPNPFKDFREQLRKDTVKRYPIDESFPKSWGELINTIRPDIEGISRYLDTFLSQKEIRIIMASINETINSSVKVPLNQILFGPPGTGKTFNTINKALEIINEGEEKGLNWEDRDEVKEQFDQRIKEGRIVFTTFHQSMSYEDFIEGIKPLKPSKEDAFLKYDIQDGIFKTLCQKASSNYMNSKEEFNEMISFEEAFERLKDDWEANNSIKFPLKTPGYDYTITGFTTTSIQFKKASGGMSHTLSINTLKDLYYGKEFNFKQGVGIYYPSILEKVKSYKGEVKEKVKLQNYVLIIDEINRGNVSQIFGELITLIESDKRLGEKESLELTLPYSKESFSVPPNLYILGTMNTADRSVEALDSALRRRFSFTEMPPRPELLNSARKVWQLWWEFKDSSWDDNDFEKIEGELYKLIGFDVAFDEKNALWGQIKDKGQDKSQIELFQKFNYTGIDLEQLLKTINLRIEKLLDRDHQIGHSYFINVFSLDDLRHSFQKSIIPLLQEYFFGDYSKIGLVLGAGFVSLKEWNKEEHSFADFNTESASDYDDKPSYQILNYPDLKTKHLVKIDGSKEVEKTFKEAIELLMKKK